MRLLLLAVLAGPPAAAAPFDQYQLIMWQEHSPAEIEGLKRLGFTATKLRATGGQIDPADLAAHIASGLPWYLENVATDLYASYHRYTPGREVGWRFAEAQQRHRADPSDRSVYIREPGLSDPVWLGRIEARLRDLAQAQSRFHPLYYNLADEAGIAELATGWDFDISGESLAGFRRWLRTRYPSLPALNDEWGTAFPTWDDVQPELTDAALTRSDGDFAAWSDFKAWMDVAFSSAVRLGTDALHRADPAALSGLEGGQVPGWGGYDYFRLAPAVDVMEIYDAGDSVALARAANPKLILLRTSFSMHEDGPIWRSLLQGGRGTIVWDEDSIVEPDGSAKPRGAALAKLIGDVGAVAPTLFASQPMQDGVAVLVSQASFRLTWLLDRKPGGPAWAERSTARENEDNRWRASRREFLQRLGGLGIMPQFVSSEMLEQGALARSGLRVLILPHAVALSDDEVAAIRAFAAGGGTVIADTEPGLFDGHLRRRAAPPLDGIATIPEAIIHTGLAPDPGALDATANLLASSGIVPRATVQTKDGVRAAGVEIRWFRHGEDDLLSIQAWPTANGPAVLDVVLPSARAITDLRRAGPATTTSRLRIELPPAAPTLLMLAGHR